MRKLLIPVLLLLALTAPVAGQSTGTLIPNVPGQFFDNTGAVCSGCLLYTYTAGTTTPLSTYSDVSLSTPNANPVVLDSAGRATIYLSSASYKFVLKTSGGSTIWTRDNVGAVPATTTEASFNSVCDFRLSATSAVPVTTADVTAATSIHLVPYKGNKCAVYDGAQWNILSSSGISMSIAGFSASTNYDIFFYSNAGVGAIEQVAWTNATTRATSIAYQDGILVKSSDTTKRYIGTFRTTGVVGQTEDSMARRYVWNMYNRVPRPLRVLEATNSWTYTTNTWRQMNNNSINLIQLVVGWAETPLSVDVFAFASNSAASSVAVAVSIAEDSNTAPGSSVIGRYGGTIASTGAVVPVRAHLDHFPAVGYHYYAAMEISEATGTTTWYGDSGGSILQAGIVGVIQG